MTDTDLIKRAKAVLNKGEGMTPGPWQVTHRKDDFTVHGVIAAGDDLVGGDMSEADARTIAATPEAHAVIRELLAENELLRDALADIAAIKVEPTRHWSGPSPEGELDATVPAGDLEYAVEIAVDVLKEAQANDWQTHPIQRPYGSSNP